MGEVIFVTGTDTGVGKTLLTALLLTHLQRRQVIVRAMKPFCSGSPKDVELLYKLQEGQLGKASINPFYFAEPVAPLVAIRKHRASVALGDVVQRIRFVQAQCDVLIVEGAGGLLVPLGEGYMVADVIAALCCPVVVVARNKLGAINHVMLTVKVLRASKVAEIKVVLMESSMKRDLAAGTNAAVLRGLIAPLRLFSMPYLGKGLTSAGLSAIKKCEKKLKKTLAQIVRRDNFHTFYESSGCRRERNKKTC